MELRYEIIKSLGDGTLLDSKCVAYPYCGTRQLRVGYYVVIWAQADSPRIYGEEAFYFGPFAMELQAKVRFRQCIEEYFAERGDTGEEIVLPALIQPRHSMAH